jgi:uncharacterized protein YdaU (DUF1376 family)
MKNPPSFQFYPQDFLSDLNVQSMNDEQVGKYQKLLCYCWIEDGLEIGSPLVEEWFQAHPILRRCFIEKDGQYRHPRLDKERQKQISWREKSSIGGHHSAENKRLLKGGSTKGKPRANSSSSSSSLLNPLTPFEKGGHKKPNNRKTRRLAVGSSGNVAEDVARATERNRKRFPELAEKE